jgi:hypothetical protein
MSDASPRKPWFILLALIPTLLFLAGAICHFIAGTAAMRGEDTQPYGHLGTIMLISGGVLFLIFKACGLMKPIRPSKS